MKKHKLLVASDSWAWVWFPEINGSSFFKSRRHTEAIDTGFLFFDGFPIMKSLYSAYGYDISFCGWPGSCNTDQVDSLAKFSDADVVLFMQTDPLRDIIHLQKIKQGYANTEYPSEAEVATQLGLPQWSVAQFENAIKQTLNDIYINLCETVSKHHPNSKVIVIGANSVVQTDILAGVSKNYECDIHVLSTCIMADIAKILIPELTLPDFHPCLFFRLSVDESWNPDLVEHLYSLAFSSMRGHRRDLIGSLMWPDAAHMNATGHIMLLEMVNQYLESRDE
jgi:hypothetical protein